MQKEEDTEAENEVDYLQRMVADGETDLAHILTL